MPFDTALTEYSAAAPKSILANRDFVTFLNASLIFGVAAIAVPIVLHLIAKREPRRVVFPSVLFLDQTIGDQSQQTACSTLVVTGPANRGAWRCWPSHWLVRRFIGRCR